MRPWNSTAKDTRSEAPWYSSRSPVNALARPGQNDLVNDFVDDRRVVREDDGPTFRRHAPGNLGTDALVGAGDDDPSP